MTGTHGAPLTLCLLSHRRGGRVCVAKTHRIIALCSTPTRRRGRARQGCGPRAQPAIAGYRMIPQGGAAGYYPITGLSRRVLVGFISFFALFGGRVIDNPATRGAGCYAHTRTVWPCARPVPQQAEYVCAGRTATVEHDACFVCMWGREGVACLNKCLVAAQHEA